MSSLLVGLWAGVAVLASLVSARGDTVYLRGGEKLVGKIVVNERNNVVIQSQGLGRIKIARDRIDRIEVDAPAPSPATAAPDRPFVPPSPPTNPPPASVAATNAPKKRWFWQSKSTATDESADWIQLKSGEWLRGRLYGMQNRKLDFESDELDDLQFDWKDVHRVIAPRALVSYGDRISAWGALRVDRETVFVDGQDAVSFPRYDLVGIAPGSPRELDYWSGRFNVGLNLRAGNTEQADLVTNIKVERRTPNTHLKLEYSANYSELEGVEAANNQRATEFLDLFFTRRLFLRLPQAEYYHDPFQNIAHRLTAGGGVGYYLIDKPKVEWLIAGGPAYQWIRFETVELGEEPEHSTPALFLQSSLDITLTKRTDLEVGYQAIAAHQDSGGLTQHASLGLEIDITRRIDLDITFIIDRIGHPQTDSSGVTPEKNDFRLNLSMGLKF